MEISSGRGQQQAAGAATVDAWSGGDLTRRYPRWIPEVTRKVDL
jgi:hypothetical protein